MPDAPATTPPETSAAIGTRRLLARIAWALAIALTVAIASHPWWLAAVVANDLAKRSGRDVHFDSIRIGLTAQLAPVVVARGVRIANAPWADTSVPFAALDEARFEFAWRRTAGRYVVSKLVMHGGQAHLELSADGLRNWRLRNPDDRGPGHYWFLALEAHDASLTFTHPAIDLVFRGAASDAAAPPATGRAGDALTSHIVFDGSFRGVAYKGDLLAGRELTFRDTGRWFGVRGGAEVAGVRLEVDGRAADIFRGARIDADAILAGSSLAALRPFVGARYATPRVFRATGHVLVEGGRHALDGARASIGATDLAGDLAWSKSGERRSVRARVQGGSVDVADLLWLVGRADAALPAATPAAAATSPASGGASGAASGASPADLFAAVRELDADVVFDARKLRYAPFHALQSLKIAARLTDGQLAVSDLDVGWAGGHSAGSLALDLRQPLAIAEATIRTSGVRIESLLPAADEKKRITGAFAGQLALKASGNDTAALRSTAKGSASFNLSDGTISSLLDAELGLEGGKLIRTMLSGAEPLALPCAAATVELGGGRAELKSLVIDSANTRTTGSGTIDLRDEAIDVVLTPTPKRAGIDLSRSIRLHGHLPKPERSLVDRVAQPAVMACAPARQ